jgi:tetratricopeptide (TPR) repeat protein
MALWAPDAEARAAEEELDEDTRARLQALGYARRPAEGKSAPVDPREMMHVGNRLDAAIRMSSDGKPEAALREVEAVLAEHPEASRALYMATALYDRLGRLDEGEAALRRALALQPKAEGWVHLAWYAFQRRDFDLFESALEKAERLDPRDGGIYISRGHRAALEGRLGEALRLFEKALEVDPVRSGADARENIAILEKTLGARSPE